MTETIRTKISAVIITRNEAHRIAPTLESVTWCDEVLVVDCGSTDGTVELCQARGCRVMHHDFSGYGEQKCFAVSQAAHDWVLAIDADEVVSPELAQEIQRRLGGDPAPTAGFILPRTLVFMGREFGFGAEHRQPQLRLFDRRRGSFSADILHERVELQGATETLQGRLLHYSYPDISAYCDKFNRYTGLAAQCMRANGQRDSLVAVVLAQPFTFLRSYLLQGNVLNGLPGFVWALLSSFFPAVKHLKLYELERRDQGGHGRI